MTVLLADKVHKQNSVNDYTQCCTDFKKSRNEKFLKYFYQKKKKNRDKSL